MFKGQALLCPTLLSDFMGKGHTAEGQQEEAFLPTGTAEPTSRAEGRE